MNWKKWRLVTGLYLATNIAFVVQRVTFDLQRGLPLEIVNSLLDLGIFAGIWALLAIPIVIFTSRRHLSTATVALLFGLGILFSLVHGAVYLLVTMQIPGLTEGPGIASVPEYFTVLAGLGHAWRFLSFGFLAVVSYAYDYYALSIERERRAVQLQVQLTEAKLNALRMQMHPHFLFNTLNAITVLVDENPAAAKETLARLSDLLRLALENVRTQEVPLRRELEFLDTYLDIQRIRYGDRLTVSRAVGPDTLEAAVPYLILQPVVENALKHGIDTLPGPGTVAISAFRENGRLIIRVDDSGEGGRRNGDPGFGLGLANTRARLQQLYGDAHALSLRPASGGMGMTVELSIPFREAAGEA